MHGQSAPNEICKHHDLSQQKFDGRLEFFIKNLYNPYSNNSLSWKTKKKK